jgi:hypothetical protein
MALGCGNSASTTTNITTPTSARCEATVSAPPSTFTSAGGSGTLSIAVARECAWRATTPVDWITFTSSVEGQGDGSVAFRIAENSEPVSRQASVAVADRQVPLAQAGAACRYGIRAPTVPIADGGGEFPIDVETHPACSWTAQAAQSWATVAPASGTGEAVIRVIAEPNSGPAREVDVIVAGERVTVRQNAFAAPPAPTPTPTPPTPTPAPPGPTPTPTPPTPAPTPTPPGPTPVRTIELSGKIDKLAGGCPSRTFTLAGYVVYTTAATTYDDGACKDMKNKKEVDVRGVLMSDGQVRADRIQLDDDENE